MVRLLLRGSHKGNLSLFLVSVRDYGGYHILSVQSNKWGKKKIRIISHICERVFRNLETIERRGILFVREPQQDSVLLLVLQLVGSHYIAIPNNHKQIKKKRRSQFSLIMLKFRRDPLRFRRSLFFLESEAHVAYFFCFDLLCFCSQHASLRFFFLYSHTTSFITHHSPSIF